MKRTICILLCLAFLACQPTPEVEYVVGKVPPKPEATAQTKSIEDTFDNEPAPTYYEDRIAVNKGALTEIRFVAALENMDVNICPIYPLTPVSFDAETVDRLIRAFAPDARISVGEGSMTLQDIEKEIAETLDHINNVDTMEFESEAAKEEYLREEQEYLSELQEAYRRMQNVTVEFVDAAALTARDKASFRLVDASGQTVAQGNTSCGIEPGDPRASFFGLQRKEATFIADPGPQDVAVLQPICEAFLQDAGIEGFTFCGVEPRGELSELIYTRSVGELPYAAAYGITALQWRDYDSGELFPEPAWMDESISFLCIGGRVSTISWLSKSDVGQPMQEMPVLPFSEMKQRIVNGLTFQWSMPLDEAQESQRIEISRIQLGMKRVPVYGSVGRYQLIPVCTVIGRFVQKYRSPQDNPQIILDANYEWYGQDNVLLVLNAIDGSIVG